jgi:hypothetical protein
MLWNTKGRKWSNPKVKNKQIDGIASNIAFDIQTKHPCQPNWEISKVMVLI